MTSRFESAAADTLAALRRASIARQVEWAGAASEPLPVLFKATELGGEAGEVLNVVKKLERERLGWTGSRATVDQLADELADLVICADLLAEAYDIDLGTAIIGKFNATSEARGLATRLSDVELARWRHAKRGTEYVEVGRAKVQASIRQIEDGDTVVVYQSTEGALHAREEGEFEDGRFVRIDGARTHG